MIRNFFSTPNIVGRLFIVLLFAGGVVFAGAFDGFVVETQASSCCGGGVDDAIFSSSECCEEKCGKCGCFIAGCVDCTMISCGSDENGTACDCGAVGGGGIGGNAADSCGDECSTETDKEYMCNNDCSF